jgi:hypothetical protein
MEQIAASAQSSCGLAIVVAVATESVEADEVCHQLSCLDWIARNTPELANNRTARREHRARRAIIEHELVDAVVGAFVPSPAGQSQYKWFRDGETTTVRSARERNELLSAVCDHV